jgi:hypothetical protein
MVVATLIAIFVFVIGDALMSKYSSGHAERGEAQDAHATAVHWDGGKLSNQQLNELVMRRRILNHFLQTIEMEGRRPSLEAGVDPPELHVQPLLGPETPQQGVEKSVVESKLLAEAAADAGMKVSNDMLIQYLTELGRRNVSPDKMREMLKNAQVGGAKVSVDYVLEALRQEMLAHNYRMSHEFAFQTVTPQQRWQDWLRVNDRVVVEAAAVPTETYLPDVKEPTEAELTAFFDKYKDREAMPDFYGNTEMPSATPGFRIPRKIDVAYIEASYDEFLAKAEAKISDEEVAKYYDEHKDLFTKTQMGLHEDKGAKKDAEKPEAPKEKEGAKPADSVKKAEATEKKAEPSEKKAEPSEKKETPPAKDEKSDKQSPDTKKSSSRLNPAKSVFHLTAFAQDADKKDSKSDKAAEKASDAPAAKATDAKATDAKTAPPVGTPALTPPANPPADASKPVAPAATEPPKKPVEYQPLSEVKDEIRKRLAEGKVADELTQSMGGIQDQLNDAYEKWRYSDTALGESGKNELPPPPKALTDLAAIAQAKGLKSGTTGPKSLLGLRDTPVGKSSAVDANRTLLSMLFTSKDLDLYQPVKTVDIDGNRFVAMKISDTPGKVPTLAEVKDEVIKAWKKQQAFDLAMKHAEEDMKKAQDAKSPLASVFADSKSIKVVRTDPFSMLTGGDVSFAGGQLQQTPYRFSQPSEIVAPGPDFMRKVFDLKDGQLAVIPNNDHSIVYIVRVVEHQPGLNELRNNYLAEANSWYGENQMNQMHRQEVAGSLVNDIETRSNLKWDRDPDKTKGEQGQDEG